jgi:predicted RNA polymerase sigma factor
MMSMLNEVRMIRDEAALSQFKLNDLNPANMLSAVGRVGGAANEFNAALATSNYQRDSLAQLKKIAQNTKNGKVPTYL